MTEDWRRAMSNVVYLLRTRAGAKGPLWVLGNVVHWCYVRTLDSMPKPDNDNGEPR